MYILGWFFAVCSLPNISTFYLVESHCKLAGLLKLNELDSERKCEAHSIESNRIDSNRFSAHAPVGMQMRAFILIIKTEIQYEILSSIVKHIWLSCRLLPLHFDTAWIYSNHSTISILCVCWCAQERERAKKRNNNARIRSPKNNSRNRSKQFFLYEFVRCFSLVRSFLDAVAVCVFALVLSSFQFSSKIMISSLCLFRPYTALLCCSRFGAAVAAVAL